VVNADVRLMEKRKLRIGDTDEVSFKGIPSAGYIWQTEYNKEFLDVTRIVTRLSDAIGSGCLFEYTIKPVKKGKVAIEFYYGPTWKDYGSAEERKTIEYEIEE